MSLAERHQQRERGAGLDALFAPASAAVYGLSERTTPRLAANLLAGGIPVWGVNPKRREACGIACYPDLASCPDVPELVVLALGHERIEAALEDLLARAGVRVVVVPGLGAESGAAGAPVAARVAARLRAAGIAMIGPNCMGVAVPGGASPWIGTLTSDLVSGRAAAIAHSGSIAEALVSLGPRVGFRAVVSSGGEALTDAAELALHFARDPETRVVGLFLEAVRRPAAFETALRELAESDTAVVVLKVGRSRLAAAGALAHTGALAGSDRAFSALLRAYGAIRVDDFADWVEHLEAFAKGPRPRGRRVGGVTASGGEGEYFADVAERAGVELAPPSPALAARIRAEFPLFAHVGNPVDCWGIADQHVVFRRVLSLMAESGEFDVLVSVTDHSRWLVDGERELASGIAEDLRRACAESGVAPFVITVTSADAWRGDLDWSRHHDIPLLKGTAPGLRALRARMARRPPLPPPRDVAAAEPLAGEGALPELDSAAVVGRYGVAYVRARRCASPGDAAAAAQELGFPVVVKVDGPAHKARAGGVVLGLTDAASVRAAAERLGGRVLVAEQAAGGVEVLVGAVRDADQGPIVLAGVGGALAEPLGLVEASLAPLDEAGAAALVEATPALLTLLGGAVPRPLTRALVAVSRLAAEHPEVSEVDLNPLLVDAERAVALDALVVLGGAA